MTVKEIREFARERAKALGLSGKGRCYNDKHKASRAVQVGLADAGRGRNLSKTFEADMKVVEEIAKEIAAKFQIEVKACTISHGCPCCAGKSLGVRFVLPL